MDQIDLDKAKVSFSSIIEGVKGGRFDAEKLEALLQDYPYCQPLYVLKAASAKDSGNEFERHLSRAALYSPEREVLYRVIHKKLTFNPDFELKKTVSPAVAESELVVENIQDEEVLFEESDSIRRETSEPAVVVEESSAPPTEETELETVIPDQELPVLEVHHEEEVIEEEIVVEEPISEKPIFDNIAASDYFTFNKSTADPLARVEEAEPATVEEIVAEDEPLAISAQEEIKEDVAKYNDDQMPYTFLWWLHKTRKEHAHTYQPYATYRFAGDAGIKKKPVDELNHQIIENIFHFQVPFKDESERDTKPDLPQTGLGKHSHGVDLIEKFIKEEPQIRPPKAEKIDTENKARKSSEDNFDLVSETLANIYMEQMLYHKAIDTYKKLSLKFPEKSTYFAAQIIELQKKIS